MNQIMTVATIGYMAAGKVLIIISNFCSFLSAVKVWAILTVKILFVYHLFYDVISI